MFALSRSQLLAYAAVAVALLLVGARWIRSGDAAGGSAGGYTPSGGRPSGMSVSSQGGGQDVVVDVAGAVREPGVYRLPAGSRVTDAVERAGGAGGSAQLEAINLAARLTDGQQVVVPSAPPAGASAATPGASPAIGAAPAGPISLGTATVAELDTIDGIGPVTAQKIIDFRDQHGGIGSIRELDQVDGIGPATLQTLEAGLQP